MPYYASKTVFYINQDSGIHLFCGKDSQDCSTKKEYS